ncbi:hypothetical protein QNM99_27510 [Pseudomonas sp. PCH446]
MALRDTGSVLSGNFKYIVEAIIGDRIIDSGQRACKIGIFAGLGSQDLSIYLNDPFKWKEDQFHYMSASFRKVFLCVVRTSLVSKKTIRLPGSPPKSSFLVALILGLSTMDTP